MADTTSASFAQSPSRSRSRHFDVALDSPQNSVKRQRRKSFNDRSKIEEEIQQIEEEIERLKQQKEYNLAVAATKWQEQGDKTLDEENEDEVEVLEALLKEMDDGALTSLLTQGITSNSLEVLLPYLGDEKMAILPPAKSAGIEGTGSGLQVDTEVEQLDQSELGPTEQDAETALKQRIERGQELLVHLAKFGGIDFYKMKISPTTTSKQDQSNLSRSITMIGRLAGDLGEIQADVEVGEDLEREKKSGPQIVKFDLDVGDELHRALGEKYLQSLVDERNLPAFLLSIRTLLPMVKTRLRLFRTIVQVFPILTKKHTRRDVALREALEGRSTKTMQSMLVDPLVMEKLSLENERGARLDLIFAIQFNRWGHAVPNIKVQPFIPSSVQLSSSARALLKQVPDSFAHLCGHVASPLDVSPGLVTTIQAFFGLP